MRTLYEIISAAKDGEKPSYDELLYALVALEALFTFDHNFIVSLPSEPAHQKNLELWAEESFQCVKRAMEKSPKDWLEWNNDPANPEYQRRRKAALKLADRVLRAEGEEAGR